MALGAQPIAFPWPSRARGQRCDAASDASSSVQEAQNGAKEPVPAGHPLDDGHDSDARAPVPDAAAASDASCPPAAHLDGARRLVGAVGRVLRAHGVIVDPASCSSAAVRVSIEAPPRGAPLTLHIQNRFGRASDREVADVDTAASLIETWALREDESLVAPPALTPVPAVVAAPKAVVPAAAPWVVDASLEAATTSDASVWYGPTLGACGRVGRLCVGGRARVARDAGVGGPPDDRVYTRTDVDVLATVGTKLGSGPVTLTPQIGVGAGRASSSRPAPARHDERPVEREHRAPRRGRGHRGPDAVAAVVDLLGGQRDARASGPRRVWSRCLAMPDRLFPRGPRASDRAMSEGRRER